MCAGAITSTITNPIWVIKTRLQTQVHSENPKYEGILHAFNKILKQEGVRGLFRGLPVSLIGCIHVMIQFPLYESLKTRFHKGNDSKLSVYEILVSSVLAKVAATSITYPHEVLRSRFQKFSRPGVSLNITNVVKDMILKEGYHVFYQGFGITLFRVIPTSGITFAVYEYSLAAFDRWRHL
jgi:solute carrier family 25 folate transporter 32